VNQTNLVNDYWAISLIRSAANKYYKEKSWSADQFNDLIHTLLVQRPAQKSFLLNVLLKDHNDKQAWERWRNFVSSDRIHMSKWVWGFLDQFNIKSQLIHPFSIKELPENVTLFKGRQPRIFVTSPKVRCVFHWQCSTILHFQKAI
jgi:hypothetical protein